MILLYAIALAASVLLGLSAGLATYLWLEHVKKTSSGDFERVSDAVVT